MEVGAGVSINPVAFLIIQQENVKLLPVSYSSTVDKLLDYVPDFFDKMSEICKANPENNKDEKDIKKQEDKKVKVDRQKNKKIPKENMENTTYEFEYDETDSNDEENNSPEDD